MSADPAETAKRIAQLATTRRMPVAPVRAGDALLRLLVVVVLVLAGATAALVIPALHEIAQRFGA